MFQTMMNELFMELSDQHMAVVYMDNILVTATLKEHHNVVCCVHEILAENNHFLKLEKCVFEALNVESMRLVITEGQVGMDPVKGAGVKEWQVPEQLVGVQNLLGLH
jgi:hypothetical protein